MYEEERIRIEIRLKKSEKRTIEKRADDAGLTTSEWIRRRCLYDSAKQPPKEENQSSS